MPDEGMARCGGRGGDAAAAEDQQPTAAAEGTCEAGESAVNRSSLEQLALTAMREVDLALEALAAQQSAAVTGQWEVVTGECALAVPPDTMADSLSI